METAHVEFLVSALYYGKEYAKVVTLVVGAIEPKSLGGLGREIIDTGIRAAIRAGDQESGLRLARMTKDQVGRFKTWLTAVEGSISRSRCFCSGCVSRIRTAQRWVSRIQLMTESLGPLLASIASYGLQESLISRLLDALDQCGEDGFASYIRGVRERRPVTIDKGRLPQVDGLAGTLQRLERIGAYEEPEEKSVRQL